jgi:signal transduction histidine kinase
LLSPTGLRFRLFTVVLVLALPMMLLIFISAEEQRRSAAENAQQDMLRLARLTASNQYQQIEAGRQVLLALSQLSAVRTQQLDLCQARLASIIDHYPNYTNFSFTNLNGDVTCSANPLPAAGVNSRGVAWFERVIATREFTIGDYQIGRVTQRPILVLAYPVDDDAGNLIGAMTTGLSLDWLGDWLRNVEPPESARITVTDSAGTIVAIYPHDPAAIGTSLADTPPFQEAVARGEGTLTRSDDNPPGYYGFSFLGSEAGGSLVVLASIPQSVALEASNDRQNQSLGLLVAATVVVLVLGWFGADLLIVTPINTLINATERLANGDLNARTPFSYSIEELDRLAFSINQLAVSLQRREHEIVHSTDELRATVASLNEQINARQKAEHADELKLQFLGMITHELRTPLTSIKGFATTLLADDVEWDAASQQEFISIINEEADTLLEMVEQLLDLSQIEAGSLRIRREISSLKDLIGAAQRRLDALTQEHYLIIALAPNLPLLDIDRGRIIQVIVNLISNAAKYSPPQTEIRLEAHEASGFVQVTVTDQGVGIPPERIDQVFRPFNRGGAQSAAKGAGLGLAICKGIVEAHGGQIGLVSEPGVGTSVRVLLPAALRRLHANGQNGHPHDTAPLVEDGGSPNGLLPTEGIPPDGLPPL